MTDREKVIKGLECCRDYLDMGCEVSCYSEDCPYKGKWNCIPELCSNALNLLKEQEAKPPHYTHLEYLVNGKVVRVNHPECSRCFETGLDLWSAEIEKGQAYCKRCGQKVKWDGND